MNNNQYNFTQTYEGGWLESFVCKIVKHGQIPKHVAFIMDGNRRYAQKTKMEKTEGHKEGFNTLAKVLSWCRQLGVSHVTLFAFSIENFKRTQGEVDSIMNLAREKCDSLLDELDRVNEAGIRVKVAGDLHLLPKDLMERVDKIQSLTCNNDKAHLNICLAYTSRHELVAAIKNISKQMHDDKTIEDVEDINLPLLEKNLYLPRPFPDLIIRTSGEIRLSDFMLWQAQDSTLVFVDTLWPEISIWDFLKAIFQFQYQRKFVPTNY